MFFIGYLAQIPANMACVALGPRRWLPMLLVAWGAVAMCFAAVGSMASFLALRLLLGVAEAGAYPAIMYLLSLFYPPRSLGLAYTCVATATAVAGLLGAPLAAALMLLDGAAGLRGWQWLFLAEGMLPILLAAALPFLLPSSPLTARFLAPAQQQWLWREVQGHGKDIELVAPPRAAAGALDQAGSEDGNAHGSTCVEDVALLQSEQAVAGRGGRPAAAWEAGKAAGEEERGGGGDSEGGRWSGGLSAAAVRAGLLDRRVWHLSAAMLLIDVCMNSCNFWIPSIVKAALLGQLQSDGGGGSAGASPTTALLVKSSLLSALPFCGAALCMVANAQHAKRADERRLHTAVPMLAAALGLAALPMLSAAGPAPALLALTLAASGIWATHGPFFSWPSAFLDQRSAAIGFALVKTGGAVGGFAGPFLVGALADAFSGYTAAMVLLAGVAAGSAALVYVFDDRRP
ncbi:hypothetical protein CHLNCDRAFT_145219 [Chlorella variabilis]|uniref:Major facilitator superfamily (MFS) profile domain-containing protein n=1 Tax=Chlorella variabilis TaxID=554065 RepID=E1ZDY5_CHLVA|nr:hypothetical protein CHLNCDRAFT_145219 [Chlorella variabilis]EFN55937.1 hypothetical protein CHLNCDRAFT_145219 [Chlorella variabilis]|eukprot:XP_005848039.1 hypothetical protein CHLNCDRAFT_145219 [Chlorella variabilis]